MDSEYFILLPKTFVPILRYILVPYVLRIIRPDSSSLTSVIKFRYKAFPKIMEPTGSVHGKI